MFQVSRTYNCATWRPWAHLVVWVPDGTSAITTYGIAKMPYGVIRAGHYSKFQVYGTPGWELSFLFYPDEGGGFLG